MGTKIDTGYNEVKEFMDAIPRGEYLAILSDVNEEESSAGNPMLVWDFEIIEEYPGATVRGWTTLLDHALGEAKKYFKAFGTQWKKGDDLEKLAKKFVKAGTKVRLVVGTRTTHDRESGEERESNKILGIYATDQSAKSRTSTNGVTPKKGKPPADDDIPF